jgi:heme/copper-type cytochrome/quinol oxidase subunit 2
MTIGAALAVITAGAILKWAVTAHLSWIDLQTTGTVLFVVGLVALPLSIVYTFYWTQRRDDDRALRPPMG